MPPFKDAVFVISGSTIRWTGRASPSETPQRTEAMDTKPRRVVDGTSSTITIPNLAQMEEIGKWEAVPKDDY